MQMTSIKFSHGAAALPDSLMAFSQQKYKPCIAPHTKQTLLASVLLFHLYCTKHLKAFNDLVLKN